MIATPLRESTTTPLLLKGVSWQTYRALMQDVQDDRPWRIAYSDGLLELRMPLQEHEQPKGLLESLVEAIADDLDIEVLKLGSLRLESEEFERAIEPDSCFYIANESQVRGRTIDLKVDPAPDLAIESDLTSSSLNKHKIYADLQVPELWRYRRGRLTVFVRVGAEYEQRDRSLSFPFLPLSEIPRLIDESKIMGQRSALRALRLRLRPLLDDFLTAGRDGIH